MCTNYLKRTQDGMRFLPILLKAFRILTELRNREDKNNFYKLNIGDVLFVSLDLFETILHDDEGKFLNKLQIEGNESIMTIKARAIDKYLSEYDEVLRLSMSLADVENIFKEAKNNGF